MRAAPLAAALLISTVVAFLVLVPPAAAAGRPRVRIEEVVEYTIRGEFVLVNQHNVTVNDYVYVALPQNTTSQQALVLSIEPGPPSYVRDEDGNVLAVVRVTAPPGERVRLRVLYRVLVQGYVVEWGVNPPRSWPSYDVVAKFTGRTRYWNVYNVTLVNLAYKVAFADTPLSVATKLATWLVSRIEYRLNLGRAGSDQALRYGYRGYFVQGDCVEVADVYVTMARALGVPARTAYGFLLLGLSQRMWLNMSTLEQEGEALLTHWGGHMWPQVYIPPLGWVDVDMLDGMQPNVGVFSARHVVFGFEETKYYGSALTSSCIPSYLTLEYVEYHFEGRRV